MIVLGIDTSGKQGGIALVRVQDAGLTMLHCTPIEGGTFSAQLIPQVAEVLRQEKLKKEDIDAFVAASGPGSFTGLRVGLAAVKGLAEILHKPVAVVSMLEALALAARADGKVLAALDAQRKEVFFGEFDVADGRATTLREELLTQEALAAHLRGEAKPAALLVTSDASVVDLLSHAGLSVRSVPRPMAVDIARIGAAKVARGETVTVEQLDANYIRRSDAEILAKPVR